MSRGGYRPNSGRKRGSRNKRSQELIERASADGDLPLDVMLAVMRDESQPVSVRIDSAKAAAPYLHSKLTAISVDATANEMTHEEWLQTLT